MKKTYNFQKIVLGRKPVAEILHKNPAAIETVFFAREDGGLTALLDLCAHAGVRYRLVPKAELQRIHAGTHQGVLARLRPAPAMDLTDLAGTLAEAPFPIILALDQVQDPGNVGTLARSLYALGGAGILLPQDRSAFLGGYAAKAAAGALHALPVCTAVNLSRALERLADQEITVYGTAHDDTALNLWDVQFHFPAVLVLGNEDKGLRPGVRKRCATLVRIPMLREFDSLNVAQAGAIVLGEMLRQYLSGCTGENLKIPRG